MGLNQFLCHCTVFSRDYFFNLIMVSIGKRFGLAVKKSSYERFKKFREISTHYIGKSYCSFILKKNYKCECSVSFYVPGGPRFLFIFKTSSRSQHRGVVPGGARGARFWQIS